MNTTTTTDETGVDTHLEISSANAPKTTSVPEPNLSKAIAFLRSKAKEEESQETYRGFTDADFTPQHFYEFAG